MLFLACANSYQRGRRLRYLVHERKAIARLMTTLPAPFYQPVQKGNQPHGAFLDLLPQAQHRITHLHLVGHADNDHLRLESDDFETPVPPQALSQLIDLLPNLRCVYLSGCATAGLLDLLLRKDVPAILVTQTYERDHEASAIAQAFYEQLAQGASIWSAFGAVQVAHPGMQHVEVQYDIATDQITWLGQEDHGEDLSWGMYFLADNRVHLHDAPRPRQTIPYHDTPARRRWSPRRLLRYAATALGLGLLAVSIALYLQDAPEWRHLQAFW